MEEQQRIYRVLKDSEGFFKDRGSKFYSFAYPVENLEDVQGKVLVLKKRFHDARHHCFAYRLEEEGTIEFATDDGEPSHSAGDPILGAIRSSNLTWTLVVVVRYFGGTKLGIRGLIEAYRAAAEDALAHSPTEEIIAQVCFFIQFAYDQTSAIKRIFHPFDLEVQEASYTDVCQQTICIREIHFSALYEQLEQAGFSIEIIED